MTLPASAVSDFKKAAFWAVVLVLIVGSYRACFHRWVVLDLFDEAHAASPPGPTPVASVEVLPGSRCNVFRTTDDRGQVIYIASPAEGTTPKSCSLALGPQGNGPKVGDP